MQRIAIKNIHLIFQIPCTYILNFINHYYKQSNLRLYDNDAKFFNEDLVKNRLSLCRSSAKNYIYIRAPLIPIIYIYILYICSI